MRLPAFACRIGLCTFTGPNKAVLNEKEHGAKVPVSEEWILRDAGFNFSDGLDPSLFQLLNTV